MDGSLVLASLDVGKALADSGGARFRARGTCMYPTVRPGDVLHVASRTIDRVEIGDIAVCRRSGFLFGHRAIGKGERDGRPYILTRPDRAAEAGDGPTFAEDVLGVVTEIERRGRRYPTKPQRHLWPTLVYLRVRLTLQERETNARRHLMRGLAFLQRYALWAYIGRLWLGVARRSPSFVVWVPLRAGQTHDLYRAVSPEDFDVLAPTWQDRRLEAWTLVLRLGKDKRPVVRANLVPYSPPCPQAGWTVGDIQIRTRYRGLGLERVLVEKAAAILARSGVPLVESRDACGRS